MKRALTIVAIFWLALTSVSFAFWQEDVLAGVFLFFFIPTMIAISDAFKK